MSDQEEARIAASRHLDDLYGRWLVRPSPGNRFLNDRNGSIAVVRLHDVKGEYGRANARPCDPLDTLGGEADSRNKVIWARDNGRGRLAAKPRPRPVRGGLPRQ